MSSFRAVLPALANKYYFNYGGQGPLPTSSIKAITDSWYKIQELGPFTNNVWPYISNEIKETKALLSIICGVTNNRVALTENVTSGCILPLLGLPLNSGDHLLISDCEHPGVVSACKELAKRHHLIIDILKVQSLNKSVYTKTQKDNLIIQQLEKTLCQKTKVIVLSHILWNTGEIMPIELISELINNHKNKPYLLVDAAQSFGQISIKDAASKADIYAFTGHKWAFGPEGLGGVILSERVLSESNPTLVGWKSLKKEESIYSNNLNPFHTDGRRFEIATSCTPLLAGLRNSLNLLQQEGTASERLKTIKTFSNRLWSKLMAAKGINPILQTSPPAGLVAFNIDSQLSPNQIVKKLGRQSIWIRVLEDPTWLRACVHITSTEEEINKLIYSVIEITKETVL
ncbi:aminotransferase class V-fold PLP-dependent enzyme [Prochlorococcus marinus]|uniref:aminotransferase class V-fold PLP-dependent enzyme n=1 Tax=Prochlorococcus marinus TaxID=1219 RepID=UPI0022B3854B|nr:aminotransferase class V-fold PLP-dependent enzyme [Prochlorococcus marinus]